MIQSEQIEPAFACFVGEHYRMYKTVKDEYNNKEQVLKGLWECAVNIYRLTTGVVCSEFSERGVLAHANIAVRNLLSDTASFIQNEIDYDPMFSKEPRDGWVDWKSV